MPHTTHRPRAAPLRIDGAGWLHGARWCLSPNHDDRPGGSVIDLLIVHGISLPPGEFGGAYIEALFTNTLAVAEHPSFAEIAGLRVSTHLLIRRDGEMVQFVPLTKRAWHAGKSCFDGKSGCNDFSIGIELEGCDPVAYTDRQYEHLADVTSSIRREWPCITPDRIVGHSDVAPGRKTDPGPAFDWERFRTSIMRFESRQR